jgi:hypothetical protein
MEAQGGRIFWRNQASGACVTLELQRAPELPTVRLALNDVEAVQARMLDAALSPLAFYELSALLRVIESYSTEASDDWLQFLQTLRRSVEQADEFTYQELRERMHHAYFNR